VALCCDKSFAFRSEFDFGSDFGSEIESEAKSEFETNLESILKPINFLPELYINHPVIKFSNISVCEYSLVNIVFRINIILSRTRVAYKYDQEKFTWSCYLFIKGRYCKFAIKIYRCEDKSFLIDIDKIDNSGFIFRDWVNNFKICFKNTLDINQPPQSPRSIDYSFTAQTNDMVFEIYIEVLDQLAVFRSKDDTICCIDFILEILEDQNSHTYAFDAGIHFKLCYLLMELEFDQEELYATIDIILYILYLLSMSSRGKIALGKCKTLIDFLNKKICQDLQYYQLYTFELAQSILSNIV
jgi:hypothetical protein